MSSYKYDHFTGMCSIYFKILQTIHSSTWEKAKVLLDYFSIDLQFQGGFDGIELVVQTHDPDLCVYWHKRNIHVGLE